MKNILTPKYGRIWDADHLHVLYLELYSRLPSRTLFVVELYTEDHVCHFSWKQRIGMPEVSNRLLTFWLIPSLSSTRQKLILLEQEFFKIKIPRGELYFMIAVRMANQIKPSLVYQVNHAHPSSNFLIMW